MNPIDTQIKEYYQKQTLPEENLQAMQPPEDSSQPSHWPWLLPLAAAAVALLAIFLWNPSSPPQAVATEIAKNHNAQLAMEISSSDYQEVAVKLNQIKFSLTPPGGEFSRQFTLLGGRYCSIQSKRAAQLRVRENATGKMHTLYITPLTDDFSALHETTQTVKGVKVRLWTEGDRFFGLASP
jgi:anti-sigma factor RsiW